MNLLLSTWITLAKFVNDLTALKIVPRNSPSVMSHTVADIQSFAEMNNMELDPGNDMIFDFLHFNIGVLKPFVIGATRTHVETKSSFKLLGVYITSDLTWFVHCGIEKRGKGRLTLPLMS